MKIPFVSSAKASVGRRVRTSMRLIKAMSHSFYDAANPTGANERHFQGVGLISARNANDRGTRETLKKRSRYECANNGYLNGIVHTLADDLIGAGPRLQITPDDGVSRDDARVAELEFNRWARASGLWAKIRAMRQTKAGDGEIFGVMSSNSAIDHPVALDLVLIESDRVRSESDLGLDPREMDGIRFDALGNPSEYRILNHHPDDAQLGANIEQGSWVPRDDVIHYFTADRPGQIRGIPEITPAIPLAAQMRRLTLATLGAAENAASHAMFMHTDQPLDVDGDIETPEAMESFEVDSGMVNVLPEGWKPAQLRSEHPNQTYEGFKKEILAEMGRPVSMPKNIVLGDSSGSNFASAKMDHSGYFHKINVDQTEMVDQVLNRIFDRWLAQASRVEGLLPQSLRRREPPVQRTWRFPVREHVDPSKEANAAQVRLGSTTNLKVEAGRLGLDWREVMDQRLIEQEYADAIGLRSPSATQEPAGAAGPDDDDDQGAEE